MNRKIPATLNAAGIASEVGNYFTTILAVLLWYLLMIRTM